MEQSIPYRSKETYPLREKKVYRGETSSENNIEGKDGDTLPLVQSQQPKIGFTYSAFLPTIPSDAHATQPSYNPSQKLPEGHVVCQRNDATEYEQHSEEEMNVKENETPTTHTEDDAFWECYVLPVIVIIIIVLMCGVVYFALKYPRVAKVAHRTAIEVRKPHEDDQEKVTPLLMKVLNPAVTNELIKLLNETTR